MINSEELLYIVDENNNPLEPQLRSIAHKNGLWHRTTGVWIINDKKQILCQKRSMKKDINPGRQSAFFGGHLAPSETYLHNAVHEIKEELGISVANNVFIPYKVLSSNKPTHKEFQQIFALKLNKELHEFHFEQEEIDQLEWIDIKRLKEFLTDPTIDNWVKKPWDEEVFLWLDSLQS